MSAAAHSALYPGAVMHRRLRPRRHGLRYRMTPMLLDLDEIDALDRRLLLFARNRFNLFAFHDRDHGDGSDTPLRTQIEAHLAQAGLDLAGGPIRLMCLPRMLGYVFNPLSVYFCHARDGALKAIFYEVSNTFGQRHSYLIPVSEAAGPIRQDCAKAFYVSPFMDMDLFYDFRVVPPGERLAVSVTASDAEGVVLVAHFTGRRRALTDGALARLFAGLPLMTLTVTVGIHWEALRIWLKGIALRPRPPAPAEAVTVVRGRRAGA
ncbi:MAG TPA: DUF1365 domain-containing protein [Xanthobacteraceae bacterium]|nr:DUF1365 domain-containing protein [Xanthobacteraceae bacterium]